MSSIKSVHDKCYMLLDICNCLLMYDCMSVWLWHLLMYDYDASRSKPSFGSRRTVSTPCENQFSPAGEVCLVARLQTLALQWHQVMKQWQYYTITFCPKHKCSLIAVPWGSLRNLYPSISPTLPQPLQNRLTSATTIGKQSIQWVS